MYAGAGLHEGASVRDGSSSVYAHRFHKKNDRRAQADDTDAIQSLEKMASFLGKGLRMIASALAPNEIIIVGDITTVWYMFGKVVEAELKQNALSKVPKLRPAFDGNTARLRSAVALVMNGSMV